MLVDVTQTIATGMPRIHVLPEVRIEPVTDMALGDPLTIAQLHLATHAGTHIDAPVHAVPGGRTIDELPLDRFVGPGAVVGIRRDAGECIEVEDVLGTPVDVHDGDILLLDTGWGGRFHDPSYSDHPYPSLELANWCVAHGIKMLGVDCISVDMPQGRRPPGFAFPIHRTLLGAEVLIIENLASLSDVRDRRVEVYAFPMKIDGGDAGHARVVLSVGDGG